MSILLIYFWLRWIWGEPTSGAKLLGFWTPQGKWGAAPGSRWGHDNEREEWTYSPNEQRKRAQLPETTPVPAI